jgi:hypothetical protein
MSIISDPNLLSFYEVVSEQLITHSQGLPRKAGIVSWSGNFVCQLRLWNKLAIIHKPRTVISYVKFTPWHSLSLRQVFSTVAQCPCLYPPPPLQEQGGLVVPPFTVFNPLHSFLVSLPSCQSQSHITTDNQSASPSWCQAPIWDPRPIFLTPWEFLLDSCSLLFCSALSDERAGL